MIEKLRDLCNTKISSKTLYKIALVLFIITLIPMLVISFYNFGQFFGIILEKSL